jgi:SPX domain protein involved in polyphosphate accumulation
VYRLLPIWRWKIEFHVTQRIVDLLLSTIAKRPPTSVLLNMDDVSGDDGSFVLRKYWVKPHDLAHVVSALTEQLDVQLVGGSSPWARASSVYIDNAKRECYSHHVTNNGSSGANIISFRTFLNDTRRVYVERGRPHQENVTGDIANEDLFAIDGSQVGPLLQGETIRVAEKHIGLRDELEAMIQTMKLFPTVRIDYTRMAFQSADHNQVSVSLDMEIKAMQDSSVYLAEGQTSGKAVTLASLVVVHIAHSLQSALKCIHRS